MKMSCYEESNATNGREKRISQDPSTFKRKIIEPWHKTEIKPQNWNSEYNKYEFMNFYGFNPSRIEKKHKYAMVTMITNIYVNGHYL